MHYNDSKIELTLDFSPMDYSDGCPREETLDEVADGNYRVTYGTTNNKQREAIHSYMHEEGYNPNSLSSQNLHELFDGDKLIGLLSLPIIKTLSNNVATYTINIGMIYIDPSYRKNQLSYDLAWFVGTDVPFLIEPYLVDDISKNVTAFEFEINAEAETLAGYKFCGEFIDAMSIEEKVESMMIDHSPTPSVSYTENIDYVP